LIKKSKLKYEFQRVAGGENAVLSL